MGDKLERKRDYLEGFLAAKPAATDPHGVGGDLYEEVIDAHKEIYDPEITVNIYDLGLIYNVEIDEGNVLITMTLTTPHCQARTDERRVGKPGVCTCRCRWSAYT